MPELIDTDFQSLPNTSFLSNSTPRPNLRSCRRGEFSTRLGQALEVAEYRGLVVQIAYHFLGQPGALRRAFSPRQTEIDFITLHQKGIAGLRSKINASGFTPIVKRFEMLDKAPRRRRAALSFIRYNEHYQCAGAVQRSRPRVYVRIVTNHREDRFGQFTDLVVP